MNVSLDAASLELKNVCCTFGNIKAADNISLTIEKGEIFSILGPSGCGKTTLLRLCGGFENIQSGQILLGGKDITNMPPNKRELKTIFQNYALFPHLTVEENIAFGLKIAKWPKKAIKQEVDKFLELMELGSFHHRTPDTLSGGQKQRVAIARALITRPRLLLLDEPLAALDLKLRKNMLSELKKIHQESGITFVYITHDQTEAMSISSRIAVMKNGKIEQVGSPREIYSNPCNAFVAGFIGDANVILGKVVDSKIEINSFLSNCPASGKTSYANNSLLSIALRPENLELYSVDNLPSNLNTQEATVIPVEVISATYLGEVNKYEVSFNNRILAVKTSANLPLLPLGKANLVIYNKDVIALPYDREITK
jgi:spermidine/putrescine transport system ATP-binding protein